MGKILLFQGDSVTDAERTYGPKGVYHPGYLGEGYPKFIAEALAKLEPDSIVKNRGVSGNRVRDLKARWEDDCLRLKPEVLTVLIGINDTWRKYDSNDETPLEQFEADYDEILTAAREKSVHQLFLMEPFVLPFPEDRAAWRVTLDPMIHAVRRLAKKHDAYLIPLDGMFAKTGVELGYDVVTLDGVHPTEEGHRMIAEAWLAAYSAANGGLGE